MEEYSRTREATDDMHISRWVPKATNIHSIYYNTCCFSTCNNVCTNAPHCCSIGTLPVLLFQVNTGLNISLYITFLLLLNYCFCRLTNCGLSAVIKSVPIQARSGPEDSRKLRFPDFMTTVQGDGKFVSHTHRPHLPPGNSPGTHFC